MKNSIVKRFTILMAMVLMTMTNVTAAFAAEDETMNNQQVETQEVTQSGTDILDSSSLPVPTTTKYKETSETVTLPGNYSKYYDCTVTTQSMYEVPSGQDETSPDARLLSKKWKLTLTSKIDGQYFNRNVTAIQILNGYEWTRDYTFSSNSDSMSATYIPNESGIFEVIFKLDNNIIYHETINQ